MTNFQHKIVGISLAFLILAAYLFLTVAPNNFRIGITELRLHSILHEGMAKDEIKKFLDNKKTHYSEYSQGDCRIGPNSNQCKKFQHVDFALDWHPDLLGAQLYIMLFFDDENKLIGHEMINEYEGI